MAYETEKSEPIEFLPSIHIGSLDRFQHYYDFAPVGFLILNSLGIILEANYKIGASLGIPRGELIGKNFSDFLHLSSPDVLSHFLGEISSLGSSRELLTKMDCESSGLASVKLRASSIMIQEEGMAQFLLMVLPQESDQPTSRSLHFQSQIVEYLAAGVCIIRLEDRRIVYTNHEFEIMFGYERGELQGKSVDVLIVPQNGSPLELREEVGREIRLKGQWTGEIQGCRKDRSVFWCKVHTSHCDHPELGPVWIAVHEDITDSKTLSRELDEHRSNLEGMVEERTLELREVNEQLLREVEQRKRAEAKYLDLYDNSPDMKVSVDPYTGSILECNETFLNCLQCSREEVIGRPIFTFYNPDCVQKAREALEEFLEKEVLHGVVLQLCRKDGDTFDVSLDANAVYDSSRRLLYCRSSYHDITDRTRMEKLEMAKEVAEKSDRLKSEFLAAMSHEVRTPLNSIIGLTELLFLHSNLDEKQRERLDTVLKSGNTLLTVLNDILDFSRIEAGQMDIESRPFAIQETLKDVLDLFKDKAYQEGIELVCEGIEGKDLWLEGDATRIQQVLTNLISNAVKFTDQGSVSLKFSLLDSPFGKQRFRVSISDTGIGIPDSKRHEVFKAFTQAHGYVSRSLGVTGLGLAICGQLIRLMEGKISYRKNNPNGCCFWFELTLPLAANQEDVPFLFEQENWEISPPVWTRVPRVLLVEDDPANQEVGEAVLENLGCITDLAQCGQEALAHLKNMEYDLILMDCLLPGKDGLEVTRDIRELESKKEKKTPIVALTAHAMKGERERCLAAGMDDFLTKPIRISTLKEALKKWVHEYGDESPVSTEFSGSYEAEIRSLKKPEVKPSSRIKMFAGLDPEVVTRIQRVYVQESIPKYMELVGKSLGDENIKELRRALHSLRYNFKIFEEEDGILLLESLRELALGGDFQGALSLCPQIQQRVSDLQEKWRLANPA